MVRLISHISLYGNATFLVTYFGSSYIGSPVRHTYRPSNIQPYIAINTRSRIPPRRAIFGSKPHRQYIRFRSEVEIRSQVECKTDVPIRAATQLFAVDPDGRVRHRAIDFDAEIAPPRAVRQSERLPVPTRPEDRQRAGVRIQLGIKGTFDGPIVWKAKLPPLGVVKSRAFGA